MDLKNAIQIQRISSNLLVLLRHCFYGIARGRNSPAIYQVGIIGLCEGEQSAPVSVCRSQWTRTESVGDLAVETARETAGETDR